MNRTESVQTMKGLILEEKAAKQQSLEAKAKDKLETYQALQARMLDWLALDDGFQVTWSPACNELEHHDRLAACVTYKDCKVMVYSGDVFYEHEDEWSLSGVDFMAVRCSNSGRHSSQKEFRAAFDRAMAEALLKKEDVEANFPFD